MTTDASRDYAPRRLSETAQETADREPLINVHRDRIAAGITGLFEQLDELSARLRPVLIYDEEQPTTSVVAAVEPASTQSDVAGHLDGFANDINLIYRRLGDLRRRLDV